MKMKNEPEYRIIPLGGLGEIGKNMMLFESREEIVVIDSGMMFPEDYMAGIDYVIPDFSYLIENRDRVKAVVLTHGHEDHIGALPYLLREINVPVYGTKLTLGFAQNRLKEHSLDRMARLNEVKPRESLEFKDFKMEFFQVSHSIADCIGIAIKTDYGIIVHTGDFKVDYTPVNNEYMDFYKLAKYGEDGVLLLMSDSTNVETKGCTLSESDLKESMLKAITNATGIVLVATFASNIYRIQQIFDICRKIGKKVAILGKSMEENISMAKKLGYLNYPQSMIVSPKTVKGNKRKNVVVLTTGTQGEPMSMLTRIANDSYPHITIENGDTVILSASIIPGNEKTVTRIINKIYRKGAYVYYEGYEDIHVSGHASQEELKLVFALTRPSYFMPIHGEYRHLVHHSTLAQSMGIMKDHIILAEDGDIVKIKKSGITVDGRVDVDNVYIDGKNIGGVEENILATRYKLAQDGIITVIIPISVEEKSLYQPEMISRGFINLANSDILERAKSIAFEEVRGYINEKGYTDLNWEGIKKRVVKELKKYFKKELGQYPLIVPVIIEV